MPFIKFCCREIITMVHKYCSVRGCYSNSKNNKKLSFHRFPRDARCQTWINACRRPKLKFKTMEQLYNMYVCSLHFEEWMYLRTKLKSAAIPILNLPSVPMCDTSTQTDIKDLDSRHVQTKIHATTVCKSGGASNTAHTTVLTTEDELFINMIRGFPELYDVNHVFYDDRPRRDNIWREIGHKMNQPAQSCRERWKRIRDNYRRAQKLRAEKSAKMKAYGDVVQHMSCPKNEKLLSFVNPFLGNMTENVAFVPMSDHYDSSNENNSLLEEIRRTDIITMTSVSPSSDDVPNQHPPYKRKCLDPPEYPEQVFLEQNYDPLQPKRSKIVKFFTNLGETVKDFPEDVQIRVKREAFRIVSEAEEMVLNSRIAAAVRDTVKQESSPEH